MLILVLAASSYLFLWEESRKTPYFEDSSRTILLTETTLSQIFSLLLEDYFILEGDSKRY